MVRGLIDYMALTDEVRERAGEPPKPVIRHILRPRTILYTALWSLVGIGLLVALFVRADLDLSVTPERNPPYVTLSDGAIRNTYDIRVLNKHGEARPFRITVKGDLALRLSLEGSIHQTVDVPADSTQLQRVYVVAPPGSAPAAADRTEIRFWVEDLINGDRAYRDSTFNGAGE